MEKDFLKKIVEHKREEISSAEKEISLAELRSKAETRTDFRPFYETLKKPGPSGVNIIAEIKRASPSKGPICMDLVPSNLACEYESGGAVAISVLTEQGYFKGSPNDLKAARNASSLPVLRKDFIISPYQIYESAVMGADAILLIVRILTKEELTDFLTLTRELNLDALVEINAEKEVNIASEAGAELIGINNRDLKTFKTDIQTAIHLKSLLGPDQIAVAASGINTRDDINKNLEIGIYNFLIGESIVRADNTRTFLQSLIKS